VRTVTPRGRIVAGWVLEDQLGSGAFGQVWKARRQHVGLYRALKLTPITDQSAFDSWRHEIDRLESLSHPNIVRFYDADVVADGPYRDHAWIATELCDHSLAHELARLDRRPLPEPECERLLAGMLAALAAAHASGCVHRDVKPANILRHGNGTWKLCDFGTARLVPSGAAYPETRVVGTFPYMSRAAHHGHQDQFADLYALGVTLHQALTGRVLHPRPPGMTDSEYLKFVMDTAPALSTDLPRRWQTVVAALIGVHGNHSAAQLRSWFAETGGSAPPRREASLVGEASPRPNGAAGRLGETSPAGPATGPTMHDATGRTEVRARTAAAQPPVAAPPPVAAQPPPRVLVAAPPARRPAPRAPAPPRRVPAPPVRTTPGWVPPRRAPTPVTGRRALAFVVDAMLLLLMGGLLWRFVLATQYEAIPRSSVDAEDPCAALDAASTVCLTVADTVYVAEGDPWPMWAVFLAPSVVASVVVEGATGVTVGKFLFGLRTVRSDGRRPGLGRALVRWLLWVVDLAPWCVPLVGVTAVLSSRGHRRVGDLVAGTVVMRRREVPRS
jgi:serine/threonine protein kinase/uncharacterized RDD family membrane protein YckC